MFISTFSKYVEIHQNYTLKIYLCSGDQSLDIIKSLYSMYFFVWYNTLFWKLFNYVWATQREAEVERIRGNTMA